MMYTAVEGFAKLITVGRVREVKPISMCILLLFNPNSSDEEPIQQCLSLFFSSFLLLKGKNFANNARLFAKAFLPTIKIILHAPLSSPLSKISVQQFSNWTFSFFPENHQDFTDKDCYEKHKETIDQIRASLTKFILNEILKNDFKNEKDNAEALIFSKLLLPIRLVPDNKEIAKIVKRIIKKLEDENCDKFVKINLRRFIRSNSIK
ncbi:hypothetical protein MHBO_001864 [Bonamia ostreae]|uniref:Nuclear condensin complex subunit 3 C-terminal domain-containing protein n=2 Tax=Bonamia ostreae TaxID=126728 RepID=A0ABV2AKE6_9EUKA